MYNVHQQLYSWADLALLQPGRLPRLADDATLVFCDFYNDLVKYLSASRLLKLTEVSRSATDYTTISVTATHMASHSGVDILH
jgi:hypothetical protein